MAAAGGQCKPLLSAPARPRNHSPSIRRRGARRRRSRFRLRAGRAGATVNDVEVHGPTGLHPGDVLSEAELQYLVLPAPVAAHDMDSLRSSNTGAGSAAWRKRSRQPMARFAVLLGRSGAFTPEFLAATLAEFSPLPGVRQIVGTFGRNVLEVLVLGDPAGVDAFRQFVSDRAAREEETVRWGMARFPGTVRPPRSSGPSRWIASWGWSPSNRLSWSGAIRA